jgi:hypothetical protein
MGYEVEANDSVGETGLVVCIATQSHSSRELASEVMQAIGGETLITGTGEPWNQGYPEYAGYVMACVGGRVEYVGSASGPKPRVEKARRG